MIQTKKDLIKTPYEEVNYVIECAEFVGIPITDETPLDFKLMAEIMRRLRESK